MQLVILAAGKSSRFHPFNQDIHKCQNILYGRSILEWTLESVKLAHIDHVVIVKSPDNQSITQVTQQRYPFQITFVDQQDWDGQAGAIISAREHLDDQFIVINNNHVDIHKTLEEISRDPYQGVALFACPTDQPHLYGMVKVSETNRALSLIEKPQTDIGPALRVVGIYQLTKDFVQFMASLPNAEYLLETALDQYIQNNQVHVYQLTNVPSSAKFPWHLFKVQQTLSTLITPYQSDQADIHPTAIIEDTVIIEPGAKILEHAVVKGHSYIGKNVIVGTNSMVRDSLLEEGVQIGYNSEVTRSILMRNTHSHGGGFIGDSIIGENCRIGAGFITGNRRTDRQEIKAIVNSQSTSTGLTSLGTLMGANTKVGIRVSTMPNVIISPDSIIPPGEVVYKNR